MLWWCPDPFGVCREHPAWCCDPTTRARPFLTLCTPPRAATKPSRVCCWFSSKLQSSLDAASSSSVPPHRAQLCPKSWQRSPGTAREAPPAPCSAQRIFSHVFTSHQDLTLVDPNSYSRLLLETFPTFSIPSASSPPTSSTSLSGRAGLSPCSHLSFTRWGEVGQSLRISWLF